MRGIFGLSSSQGGRSRVDSFGERYGGAVMDDVGPTRNSSSISITVINPGSGYRRRTQTVGFRNGRLLTQRPLPAVRSLTAASSADRRSSQLKCTQAEAKLFRMFRGSIVGKTSDNTFSKLRITRAYIKLLCLPEGEAKIVSLLQIGNYEIRMLEVSKADTADGPLFLIELFDHDAQSAVDSCVCDDVEEGVAAFERFRSR